MAKKKKTTRRKTTGRKKTTRKKTTARRAATRTTGGRTASRLGNASLDSIRAELDKRLKELEAERDRLSKELAAVEGEISSFPGAHVRGRSGPRKRPRNDMNLVDSLKKLLTNKTLSVTEMTSEVQRSGYRTTSPNFRTIVNQTLIANPKVFKRVSRGMYTSK